MPTKPRPPKLNPVYIILTGIVLLAGIGGIIIFRPCLTDSQFFFVRVVLGLVAALFMAVLPGSIRIDSKILQTGIRAVGSPAIFLLIYKFTPDFLPSAADCKPLVNYTFILRDSSNASINKLKGQVLVTFGNEVGEKEIINGIADYKRIAAQDMNKRLKIELKADGWVFQRTGKKVIDTALRGESMLLNLIPDDLYCCVTGKIIDESTGLGLPGIAVSVADIDSVTDKAGKFKIPVPLNQRDQTLVLNVTSPAYKIYTTEVSVYSTASHDYYIHKKKGK